MFNRLPAAFFQRNVLDVAPELPGKIVVRHFDNGVIKRYLITDVEAYSGDGDIACHASKGKTPRTKVMFREGGLVYVYLIYGIHWLLNFVTGKAGDASAVLIRGLHGIDGPGRVGKVLCMNKSFYGENLENSSRLWVEDPGKPVKYRALPRVGIDYAGEPWVSMPWRYKLISPE